MQVFALVSRLPIHLLYAWLSECSLTVDSRHSEPACLVNSTTQMKTPKPTTLQGNNHTIRTTSKIMMRDGTMIHVNLVVPMDNTRTMTTEITPDTVTSIMKAAK